jgi:hypothetical protein
VPKLFLSHAYADRHFVDAFAETILVCGLGLSRKTDFFYSSADSSGISHGSDLMHTLREEAEEASLVLAFISPTYQSRPTCVAELGAAWAKPGALFPLLMPGVGRSELQGVLVGMKVDRLDDRTALNALRDRISSSIGIVVNSTDWETYLDRWLHQVYQLTLRLPVLSTASVGCGHHLEAFRVVGGAIEHRWYPNNDEAEVAGDVVHWTGWEPLDMPRFNAVAVAAASAWENHVALFVLDTVGTVHLREWFLDTWWQSWQHLSDRRSPVLTGPITAASRREGHIEVYGEDLGGTWWSNYREHLPGQDPGWKGWERRDQL